MICVGSLLLELPTQFLGFQAYAQNLEQSSVPQNLSERLSEQQLRQITQSITVKVLSGEIWGSGVLIEKQGNLYTVLTNDHVIRQQRSKGWQIQAPDGQIYRGNLARTVRFDNYDLGLIVFHSAKAYTIASLTTSATLAVGDEVFAAGFPYDLDRAKPQGFIFTTGKVSLLSDKAFASGYQIGYTNDIENGMSGGPLLNRQGQLIGINGIHAYPLWGNPYVFADGSVASKAMQEKMSQLSWAIPIQTFLQLEPGFSPIPATSSSRQPQFFTPETRQSPLSQPPMLVAPKPSLPQPKSPLW